jgi:hypothetical protein
MEFPVLMETICSSLSSKEPDSGSSPEPDHSTSLCRISISIIYTYEGFCLLGYNAVTNILEEQVTSTFRVEE